MRLIDADSIKYHRTTECGGHGVFLDVDMVYKEEIDAIPTIDPESLRPRARWLGEIVLVNGTMSQECSHCHRIRPIDDFCAACGAKMEGGEENAAD